MLRKIHLFLLGSQVWDLSELAAAHGTRDEAEVLEEIGLGVGSAREDVVLMVVVAGVFVGQTHHPACQLVHFLGVRLVLDI